MVERVLIVPFLAAFLLTVFLAPQAGAGTIYQWEDSNGCVHFSNIPNDPRFRPWVEERRSKNFLEERRKLHTLVEKAGNKHRVNPDLIKAIIKVESDFNPEAISPKGALGLMQLMPDTARRWGVSRVFDPEENVEGGILHFKFLMDMFSHNLKKALAAYNAGEQPVMRYQNIPPFPETEHFVKSVISEFKKLQAQRYKN
jgi:soluble lytic murein transglycosylase